jgi:hypothetical protein
MAVRALELRGRSRTALENIASFAFKASHRRLMPEPRTRWLDTSFQPPPPTPRTPLVLQAASFVARDADTGFESFTELVARLGDARSPEALFGVLRNRPR